MARRRVNMLEDNENLSNENIETNINQENEDKPVLNENENMNNLSIEEKEEKQEEPKEPKKPEEDVKIETVTLKPGDKVKIKENVGNDTLGRRIHPGVQKYVYTVRSIRPDGVACVECLTHIFNVDLKDLIIL